MKRLIALGSVALMTAGSAMAFLSPGDPALVTAIAARSGDVYLRIKDKRTGVGGVYKFRPSDLNYLRLSQKLFAVGASNGLAVDKFARVTVLEDSGTGGRKDLSSLTPSVGAGQLLAIHKSTGALNVVNLGAPQAQATSPGSRGFATPDPSWDYVPAAHNIGHNAQRTGVHADHNFREWMANGSNREYSNVLTGLDQWYLSDVIGRDRHGRSGRNNARAKSGWYEANLFQIKSWISSPDFNTFPQPGLSNSFLNALGALGNPITSSLKTGYALEFFSSCGDRCLASVGSKDVASTLKVPAKIVFSSEGLTAASQRVYGIQASADSAKVLKYKLNGSVWVTEGVDAADVIESHGLRTSGQVETFGVASKSSATDYVYKSELPAQQFSVSGKFFRDGATLYGYKQSGGRVDWEDRNEVGGAKITGKITNLGTDVKVITSDGRGNMYYFIEEKSPTDGNVSPAFEGINVNNPILTTDESAPGPFKYEDALLELPGGQQTVTTEVVEITTKIFTYAPAPLQFSLPSSPLNVPRTIQVPANVKTTKRTEFRDASGTTVQQGSPVTSQENMKLTVTAAQNSGSSVNLQNKLLTADPPAEFELIGYKNNLGSHQVCLPAVKKTESTQTFPDVQTSTSQKEETVSVSIKTSHETSGCVQNVATPASLVIQGSFNLTEKVTITKRTKTVTTYKGTIARTFFYRQTQQFGLHAVNVQESDSSRILDARQKSIERGGLVLDYQVWSRTAYKGPQDSAFSYKADEPPILDLAATGGKVEYEFDADTIKLTDPPETKIKFAVVDVAALSGSDWMYAEDSSPSFKMENTPVWNGVFAGPYGNMNTNYIGAGYSGSTDTDDGDGVRGFVGDTMYKDEFKWRWIVRAVSEPLKSSWHNGKRVKASQSNNGVVFPSTTVTLTTGDPEGSSYGWRTIGGANWTGARPVVAFNDAGSNPLDKFRFRDPGEYEIELQIRGKYFDTSGLTFANTADDVTEGQYGPNASRKNEANYVYIVPRKEVLRVEAKTPLSKQYVWDIEGKGPSMVPEDVTTATASNNWYAEAYLRFYAGIDYDYYDGVPPPKDMVKYHGVGQYLYPKVDPASLSEQDWIAVRDGVSDFGTRKDELKREDFEAITYEWFLKVTDPDDPSKLLPAGMGAVIASGTLAEVWDLQKLTKVTGSGPSSPANLRKAILGANQSNVLEVLPSSNTVFPRTVRIRVPLITQELVTQLALGTASKSVVLPQHLRASFDVPTDPSAIQLACRLKYPRVKWVNNDQPRRTHDGRTVYYDLVNEPGDWYGFYKKSRNGATYFDKPQIANADPATEDGDDYWETIVLDTTDPWVSAQGMDGTFDPQKPGSTVLMEFDDTSQVTSGKGLPLQNVDDIYRVYVVDNNPYLHWDIWNGASQTNEWPRLVAFHYEVGDDVRNRDSTHGGVGLKDTGDRFGWDISHTGNTFNLSANDFGSTVVDPSPNSLPNQSSYVYGTNKIKTWGPFTYGVHFDNITGASAPAYNSTSSHSKLFSNISYWARTDHVNVTDAKALDQAAEAYRVAQWEFMDMEMPMPIFMEDRQNLLVKMGGEGKDRSNYINSAWGVTANRSSGPTQVGGALVNDVDPPNLLIELVDFKTGVPVYFAAFKDFGRDWGTTPIDITSEWQVFKASADNRGVYVGYPSEARPNGLVYPSASAGQMPQATIMDFRDPSGWADPGASFNYRVEEDVRFRITAKAADNGSTAQNIRLSIEGVEGTAQTHFPRTLKDIGSTGINTGGAAAQMGTHYYPSAGETDTIHVTATDLAGNQREVTLHIDVVAHDADYRVIGDSDRRNR